jgi:PKD repeat protein
LLRLSVFLGFRNGLTVTVNGSAALGYSGASITRIRWEWGDGSSEDSLFPATHTYSSPGAYTVTVTAYQSNGFSTSKNLAVTVGAVNKPPVADFSLLLQPLKPLGQ